MGVVDDPAMHGVEESFAKTENLTARDLQARINVKREQAEADSGWSAPSTMDTEVEPLEPDTGPVTEIPDEGETAPAEPEEPDTEDGQEVPEEELPEEPQDEFFVGRYKTREAAEAALAEKDRMIDQFFREREQYAQIEQEPQELDVGAWHEWAEQMVASGAGERGALEALQNGGAEGYDIYLGHWASDPDQAPLAHAFNNEVQRQFAEARAMQAVAPVMQREQASAAAGEAQRARAMISQQYPDFDEYDETINRLINEPGALPEETRMRLTQMAQIGLEGKLHAWDFLYHAAQASQGRKRGRAQAVADGRSKEASDRAKIAATVSASEGSQTRTPPSAAEAYVSDRKNAIREKMGLPLIERQ